YPPQGAHRREGTALRGHHRALRRLAPDSRGLSRTANAVKSPHHGATMPWLTQHQCGSKMKRRLAFGFWLIMTATAVALPGGRPASESNLIPAGLTDDPATTPAPVATPAPATTTGDAANASCTGVTVTRGLKYGGDAMNVLDVTSAQTGGAKRPVL